LGQDDKRVEANLKSEISEKRKKKTMKKNRVFLAAVLVGVLAGWCTSGYAVGVYPVTVAEAALHPGATHVLIIKHTDLTVATTNGVQTNSTLNVAAKMGVELVDMELPTAFNAGLWWATARTRICTWRARSSTATAPKCS